MTTYVNRAKVAVASAPGTGTISLGAAVAGYQDFAAAGITNGQTDVAYVLEDGYAWEIGTGTYSSTGPTLTRDTVIESSAGGTTKINASGYTVVYNTLLAQDIGGASVVVDTTAITGGTSGRILYDNAGTVGELATTGTGNVVRATSPTLTTPTLGAASATSVNKVTITAPATGSTLTIADGKTLTASNTLTLAGTDGSTLNVGTGGTLDTGAFAAAYSLPTATASVLGGVKPDGTTITNTSGAISVTYGTASNTAAQGNDSRITGALQTSSLGTGVATAAGNAVNASGGLITYSAFAPASGKSLTLSNTLTFTGTDSSSVAFGTGGTVLYSGGALGTPSSGTLTNATGLPVGGISATGTPSNTTYLRGDGSWQTVSVTSTGTVGYTIDGGGTVIVTGIAGAGVRVPFGGTITSVTLLADISGSVKIDILKDTYANYSPFTTGSICSTSLPALSSAVKYEDTTLTGWTTSFSAGDVFRFKVDSSVTPAGVTNLAILLKVTKS